MDNNESKKLTILTVEDDPSTRKGFSLFLKSRGYHVLEANNGRSGLEMFRLEKPDLLLLDLRMPEMDGLEVLGHGTSESPDTPVVMVSGTEKISAAMEALHQGAWDYVLKPVQDMQVLLHAVKKALERACLIRENRRYHEKLEEDIRLRTRELQTANDSLRQNEKAYRSIFNAATAGLFIVGGNLCIILAGSHSCQYFKCEPGYFRGLKVHNLIHPDDRYKFQAMLEKVELVPRQQKELKALRPDGSHFMTETVVTTVGYKGVNRLLVVVRDINERKLAEEKEKIHHQQLIQADKMASLGMLVSGVAHEINNPNNFVMVNAPILAKVWKSIEPILKKYYAEYGDFYVAPRVKYSEVSDDIPGIISGIQEGAKRIGNFVNELKNFARPVAAAMENGIDINKVVRSAVVLLTRTIKNATANFSVAYGEALPPVRGNFQRLEQVVVNLLENSCHALPDQNRALAIITALDGEKGMVRVTIRDEGSGIDPEIINKIKNPFFTTKRELGGTGLGLSISSRIIDDHNGSLEFESLPGTGTTATVLLRLEPGLTQSTGS